MSDNYLDPALSLRGNLPRQLAGETSVRPSAAAPRMVENWNHALPFAAGDYICYLTDKMLSCGRAWPYRACDRCGRRPRLVSWTSDFYFSRELPRLLRRRDVRRREQLQGSDGSVSVLSPAASWTFGVPLRNPVVSILPRNTAAGSSCFGRNRRELLRGS